MPSAAAAADAETVADGLPSIMQTETADLEPDSDPSSESSDYRVEPLVDADDSPAVDQEPDLVSDVEPEQDASADRPRSWLGNAWASLMTLLKGQRTGDKNDGS